MTKAQIRETKKLINSLENQLEQLRDMLLADTKEKPVVNTNLENRNYDVFICREYLHMTYDEIANALRISKAQVGEALKVLRDRGLVESSRKAPSLIEDYLPDVKAMAKKKYSRSQMAKELGVSEKTVVRCLERLSI